MAQQQMFMDPSEAIEIPTLITCEDGELSSDLEFALKTYYNGLGLLDQSEAHQNEFDVVRWIKEDSRVVAAFIGGKTCAVKSMDLTENNTTHHIGAMFRNAGKVCFLSSNFIDALPCVDLCDTRGNMQQVSVGVLSTENLQRLREINTDYQKSKSDEMVKKETMCQERLDEIQRRMQLNRDINIVSQHGGPRDDEQPVAAACGPFPAGNKRSWTVASQQEVPAAQTVNKKMKTASKKGRNKCATDEISLNAAAAAVDILAAASSVIPQRPNSV